MIPPAAFVRHARRLLLLATGALALYAFARFDIVRLPPGARSPLHGVRPGDRLVVDRQARDGTAGESWLFRGPSDELLIGRVAPAPLELDPAARAALSDGALWLVCERNVPGGADSRTLGPIRRQARVGRVLFVLPW